MAAILSSRLSTLQLLRAIPIATVLVPLLAAPASARSDAGQEPRLRSRVLERSRTRIVCFGKDRKRPSPGQVSIEHSMLKWAELPADHLAKTDQDGSWIFGDEDWPTLDVNVPILFEKRKVGAGLYYFAFERAKGRLSLVLLDAAKVRAARARDAAAAASAQVASFPLDPDVHVGEPTYLVMLGFEDRMKSEERLRLRLDLGSTRVGTTFEFPPADKAKPTPVQIEKRSRAVLELDGAQDDAVRRLATVEHGLPPWSDAHAKAMAELAPGGRWRFGKNFWTNLENEVPITIGGTRIEPGYWYLMLEKGSGREQDPPWVLVVWPSADAHKGTTEAFQAAETKGGIEIPLRAGANLTKQADKLAIEMTPAEGLAATLQIRFGPHHLTAPMQVHETSE